MLGKATCCTYVALSLMFIVYVRVFVSNFLVFFNNFDSVVELTELHTRETIPASLISIIDNIKSNQNFCNCRKKSFIIREICLPLDTLPFLTFGYLMVTFVYLWSPLVTIGYLWLPFLTFPYLSFQFMHLRKLTDKLTSYISTHLMGMLLQPKK